MRPTYIHFDHSERMLFACTNRGTILKLNMRLDVVSSSAPAYNINSLNVVTGDAEFIYAREITGKLVRWRKRDLAIDRVVDLAFWSPADSANFPNISHFLHAHGGSLYVSMPSGRVGRFRQADLAFEGESEYKSHALMESIETTNQDHFGVDFSGYLYKGHIDGQMGPVARLSHGACHQIVYDRRHDRYWVTDDFHCGLAIFRADAPKKFDRIYLTNDDVEYMSFNSDQSEVLVACFDRYIYRIANEARPRVVGKLGPFRYQVTHVIWAAPDTAFALTEAGDIYKVDPETGRFSHSRTGTNAIWDLRRSAQGGSFWAAFEDGFVREIRVTSGADIETVREKDLGLGMVRRVLPARDGGLYAMMTGGHIVRLDCRLEFDWVFETAPLLRDMAINEGRLVACAETGELLSLNAESGTILWRKRFHEPLWAVSMNPGGARYLAAHRLRDRSDQGCESAGKPARLFVGDSATGEVLAEMEIFGNIKRFTWLDNQKFLINGNGKVGVSLIHFEELNVLKQWSDWQLNTCEAAVLREDKLFTTTYGYQLNTYDFEGAIMESAFPFEDYATSLVDAGGGRLLAGGRGAFLTLFGAKNDLPHLIRTVKFP